MSRYNFNDLTGKKFGRLIVLKRVENNEYGGSRWLCTCKCGNETTVSGCSLSGGGTRSCGCFSIERKKELRASDLTGKKFGKLTAIKRVRGYGVLWLCKCDCGNEAVAQGSGLRGGNNRSCGCIHTLPEGEGAFRNMFHTYKQNAEKLGRKFELTTEQFKDLINKPCYYCGKKPELRANNGNHNGGIKCNGIDRRDNDRDYEIDNCVPCCSYCNWSKGQKTEAEFAEFNRRKRCS